jgi:hypothetical protein
MQIFDAVLEAGKTDEQTSKGLQIEFDQIIPLVLKFKMANI